MVIGRDHYHLPHHQYLSFDDDERLRYDRSRDSRQAVLLAALGRKVRVRSIMERGSEHRQRELQQPSSVLVVRLCASLIVTDLSTLVKAVEETFRVRRDVQVGCGTGPERRMTEHTYPVIIRGEHRYRSLFISILFVIGPSSLREFQLKWPLELPEARAFRLLVQLRGTAGPSNPKAVRGNVRKELWQNSNVCRNVTLKGNPRDK